MTTALVYAPAMRHTKQGHPENNGRIAPILPILDEYGLLTEVTLLKPQPASETQLRRVHGQKLIDRIAQVASFGGGLLDQGDTYATADSYELARLAAGGTTLVVDGIMKGTFRNGFALVRPPGHHAATNEVGGFCLFNNAAVAARQAQAVHKAKRVAVVDLDVHHGNGTQEIFYEDNSVLFVSTHLYAPYFYPGIGSLGEMGARKGMGYTVNVPFPPGVGDMGYGRVMDQIIVPKIQSFKPQLLIVSIGYDAHWKDPLAMAGLSLRGYAQLVRTLITLADEVCNGRILFVLEGGYQLDVTINGIINTIYALLGQDLVEDPFGPMPYPEQNITQLLRQLRQTHLLW
ncbi:MAG: histone deacetylase [Candidatus Promineifilaceae bacterium]